METKFGKIARINPLQTGMGKNGQWYSIDFEIVETSIDGMTERLSLRATNSLAKSLDDLSRVCAFDGKFYEGFYRADYHAVTRPVVGKDGVSRNFTDLMVDKILRIY